MKKIIIASIIVLTLIISNTASAGMSPMRVSTPTRSYTPTRTYTPTKTYTPTRTTTKTSSYNSNSSSSIFTPTNIMLFYMITQNNRTNNELNEIKDVIAKKGYDSKGNWFYSKEGFDVNGFTPSGAWWYGKDGYDINGYDAIGNKKK